MSIIEKLGIVSLPWEIDTFGLDYPIIRDNNNRKICTVKGSYPQNESRGEFNHKKRCLASCARATGEEVDEMEIVSCSDCSLVQNCETSHVLI